ncbi:MAG: LrgB family protein [Ruminococcus callidus]
MFDFLENSAFFGVVISVASYGLGLLLKKKFKLAILNPLLISIIITIAFLACTGISYEKYDEGAKYLSYLLTPATVCLAIPLYEQLELLKHNWRCWASCPACFPACVILGMALMFGFSHEEYVTFLPKSITTAIGMGVSESWAATFPSALPPSSLPVFWQYLCRDRL